MANAKRDGNTIPTLIGVSSVDSSTPTRVAVDPATGRMLVSSSSISGGVLAATGTVDGTNTAFTFTQLPAYIVSDHAWYAQTNKIGTTNWTWNAGTLTATMTIPPQEDIFGIS